MTFKIGFISILLVAVSCQHKGSTGGSSELEAVQAVSSCLATLPRRNDTDQSDLFIGVAQDIQKYSSPVIRRAFSDYFERSGRKGYATWDLFVMTKLLVQYPEEKRVGSREAGWVIPDSDASTAWPLYRSPQGKLRVKPCNAYHSGASTDPLMFFDDCVGQYGRRKGKLE